MRRRDFLLAETYPVRPATSISSVEGRENGSDSYARSHVNFIVLEDAAAGFCKENPDTAPVHCLLFQKRFQSVHLILQLLNNLLSLFAGHLRTPELTPRVLLVASSLLLVALSFRNCSSLGGLPLVQTGSASKGLIDCSCYFYHVCCLRGWQKISLKFI